MGPVTSVMDSVAPNHPLGEVLATSLPDSQPANIFERVARAIESKRIEWSQLALSSLDDLKKRVNENKGLSWPLQNKIDMVAAAIVDRISPTIQFVNNWIDSNGHGQLWQQILTFIAKLPLRASRNILRLLYQVMEGCIRFAVHPIVTTVDLAELMVRLLSAIVMPETWAIIGAGIVGSCAGHAAATLNPVALIGTLIGEAMVVGGVSVTALKYALLAERGKKAATVQEQIENLFKNIPETVLTGFFLGLIAGGVQRAIVAYKIRHIDFKAIDDFLQEHGLSIKYEIVLKNNGDIELILSDLVKIPWLCSWDPTSAPLSVKVVISGSHVDLACAYKVPLFMECPWEWEGFNFETRWDHKFLGRLNPWSFGPVGAAGFSMAPGCVAAGSAKQ